MEAWKGIAIPASEPPEVAADGGTDDPVVSTSDTTYVVVNHQRDVESEMVYGTFVIWETDPDPYGLDWLPSNDPLCWFMTDVEGIGIPFEDPEHRVVTFTLPSYGECQLVGTVYDDGDGKLWDAVVRCGEDGESLFSVDLREERFRHPDT
ncbi:MAG: hypothetical protein OXN18_01680 [Gemmatimonadota bacterium]|nr:hypothetical protein [Gemmatimonadota bacterium]